MSIAMHNAADRAMRHDGRARVFTSVNAESKVCALFTSEPSKEMADHTGEWIQARKTLALEEMR